MANNPDSGFTRPIHHVEWNLNYVWNTSLLIWEPMTQAGGGGGGGVVDQGAAGVSPWLVNLDLDEFEGSLPVTTDGLTNAELRAVPVPVSGTVNIANAQYTTVPPLSNETGLVVRNIASGIQNVAVDLRQAVTMVQGTATAAGETVVITPPASNLLLVSYLSYNPAAPVDVKFYFKAAGEVPPNTPSSAYFFHNNVTVGGSIIAKDFGDFRHLAGDLDQPLVIVLSAAVDVIWNVVYVANDGSAGF